jgi:hypothetical protein
MSLRAWIVAIITLLVVTISAAVVWTRHRAPVPPAHPPVAFDAFAAASGWLNGGPGAADSLRGGAALILVWSDTDPLSNAALPRAQGWLEAYGRFGLHVVGVHVPEYAFAADPSVPARLVQRLGVSFPVALDAGTRVASRLGVGERTPAWLLADSRGRLEFQATGEGDERVHAAILELLRREHPDAGLAEEHAPTPGEAPEPAVTRVFCGVSGVSGGPLAHANPGSTETYTAQFRYEEQGELDTPYPVGRWTASSEGLTSARGGAADYLAVRYARGAAFAVMGAAAGTKMRVWVLCDEAWMPDSLRGDDIGGDAHGTYIEITEPRLYSLTRGGGEHVLKLSPEAPGLTLYELAFRAP